MCNCVTGYRLRGIIEKYKIAIGSSLLKSNRSIIFNFKKGGKCQDINECLNNVCPGILECSNSDGSYACNCPAGYDTIDEICVVMDLKLRI